MIKLIQSACQWGQKDFDGWVIGKARYSLHSRSEPVSYESIPKKTAPGYVLLETAAYDADRLPCQTLEICLADTRVLRNAESIKGNGHFRDSGCAKSPLFPASQAPFPTAPECMPDQVTMSFLPEDLENFLAASGDTNPIHRGPNAVIPGLWILRRLEELYGSRCPGETLSIRFLHPVRTGVSVRLIRKNNMAAGTAGTITCFTMTIQTPDQTQKRR